MARITVNKGTKGEAKTVAAELGVELSSVMVYEPLCSLSCAPLLATSLEVASVVAIVRNLIKAWLEDDVKEASVIVMVTFQTPVLVSTAAAVRLCKSSLNVTHAPLCWFLSQ